MNISCPDTVQTDNTLDTSNLSTRSRNILKKLDITTVPQLKNLDKDTLSGTKGAGAKTINEILALQETIS